MNVLTIHNETVYDFSEDVARGAEWLDEVKPGWDELVDISALDLADEKVCICGQVFVDEALYRELVGSGYEYALDYMLAEDTSQAAALGFELPGNMFLGVDPVGDAAAFSARMSAGWEHLALDWVALIEKRRANRGSP